MNKKKFILSLLVAILMVVSGLAAFTLAPSSGTNIGSHSSTAVSTIVNQPSPAASTSSAGTASNSGFSHNSSTSPAKSSWLAAAKAQGVPMKDLYIPVAPTTPNMQNGVAMPIMPGYAQGPAPFGIGAYGIKNVSGKLQAYNYTTNGFQTNLNVSALSMNYLDSFDPNGLTVQLNTILTGATVMGMDNFTYWTQNVAFYDSYAHQFEMIDNIWNFSSPASGMPSGPYNSTIYNWTAPSTQSFSGAYIGVGNLVNNVSAPFNLTLTLETSLYGGMSAVYFNYSLTFTNTSTGKLTTIGGVFDRVLFNSLTGVQGYSGAQPAFRVDGSQYNPTGFIPYDAEATIEGPGGGSNVNIGSIVGNMTLHYNNSAGNYVNVPSAYNIGSETGETSTGIAEAWSSNGVVRLTSGPSMIYGMWNVSSSTSTTHFTGTLSPSNAFMFVAPGKSIKIGPTVTAQYGYVPMTTSGQYSFYLPSGTYNYEVMLSDWSISKGTLLSSEQITLARDPSMGVYTPLYAMNNAQLANISYPGGTGTLANPYHGFNNQTGYINPLFGMFSDWGWPVFSGVFIQNTNAYIDFNNSPSFQIMYQQYQSLFYMAALYGMGAIDYLGYALYNTSNVSVYNAQLIAGTQPWIAETGYAGYTGQFILWNSTNDLIANSTFIMGEWLPYQSAIFMYNPWYIIANNTIVGNYFEDTWFDFGITLASSMNLIYNNVFNMAYNIIDWTYSGDPWTGGFGEYPNIWNVTPAPTSSFSLSVNGYSLSGNILGNSTMGGNFWNDYGYYTPFDDQGNIALGGDYAPIVPQGPYYPVWFTQMGLASGQSWSVTMGGVTHSSSTSTIEFMALPYASYSFTIQNTGNQVNIWSSNYGSVYVSPYLNTRFSSIYSQVYYLTVTQSGLPAGFQWVSDINDVGSNLGALFNYGMSNGTQTTVMFTPGEYISANYATGYYWGWPDYMDYSGNSYLIPLFSNLSITETFDPVYHLMNFSIVNLPESASWTIDLYTQYLNNTLVLEGTYTGTGYYELTPEGYGQYIQIPVMFGQYHMVFISSGYTLDYSPAYISYFPGDTFQGWYYALAAVPVTFNFQGLPAGTPVTLNLTTNILFYYVYQYTWYYYATVTSSSVTVMVPVGSYGLNYIAMPGNSAYQEFENAVAIGNASSYTVNVPFYAVAPAQSTVTFSESGLSSGATWQVTLNGQAQTASAGSTISFTEAPGSYNYQVSSAGMVSPQSSGTINVQSATQSVSVSFSPQTYSVTFIVAGLPVNSSLSVTFNGQTQNTTGEGVVFNATAGTYNYSVSSVHGYKLAAGSSSVSIDHNTVVVLSFTHSASALLYLAYAGFVGLGALAGVVGAMFIPRFLGGKKGGS